MAERNYSKATEAALFAISIKCYYPDCQVPSVSIFGQDTKKNVQIAHIVAVSPNGPRYRRLPKEERDGFRNLILLCNYHHPRVDKKANERKYTEEILRKWKEETEKNLGGKIDGLERLTKGELNEMLTTAAESTKDEITKALDELKDISNGAAELLRSLFDKVERHYIDSEAAELLYAASERLSNLEEGSHLLYVASDQLANLDDNANMLTRVTNQLLELELDRSSQRLEQFTQDYAGILREIPDLSGIASLIESAGNSLLSKIDQQIESIDHDEPLATPNEGQRWKFAAWGFVAGVIAVLSTVAILAYSGAFSH